MFFGHDSDEARAHAQLTGEVHEAKLSHELIAAAASYEAAKAYEHYREKEGNPVDHETAVKLLAAFSGGFIDRLAETRGLDAFDREHLKRDAHRQATMALEQTGQY